MSHRTVAGLVAVGLLVTLVVFAALQPVPYVTVSPGRTVDVLGEEAGRPIVQVEGHRTYPTRGELRLTTVSVTNPDHRLSLVEAMWAWLRPDDAVLPYASMYPAPVTTEQERAESSAQMVNSQDSAVAAALTALGHRLETHTEVTGVTPDGPSDGKLEPRDHIETVQGKKVTDVTGLLEAVGRAEPGDTVEVGIRREGRRLVEDIVTVPAPDDPTRALLGILIGTGYDFPFSVEVAIDDTIGGPSAGLMFALSVYDTLTPGALTQGATVAGTGTIAADGTVGPIGGVRQKIAAARDAGAELFLVPPANCESAVLAPVDEDEIRLVRAPTLRSALESLRKYTEDPSVDLPRCPS